MGWIRLKRILAAVLTLANLLLAIALVLQYRSSRYLPEESLTQAATLLAEHGIAVMDGAVPAKKPLLPILEGTLDEDYYTRTAEKLTGSAVELAFNTPAGSVMTMENGDRLAFGERFSFHYQRAGAPAYQSEEALEIESLTAGTASETRALRRCISAFLEAAQTTLSAPGASLFSWEITSLGTDLASGISYCICTQSVRDTETGFQALFAVYNAQVIGVSGAWCFAQMDTAYSAQLLDQINILYCVKNKVLEEQEDEQNDIPSICALHMIYEVYFSHETELFYLIPVWQAEMKNGETYSFNAVDGSLYTN